MRSAFALRGGKIERDYLARLLKITGGNVTQAAQLAKRNRTEFYKLLQRHRLEPAQFKKHSLSRGATRGHCRPKGLGRDP
jgi:two-component system response regulator GlrR